MAWHSGSSTMYLSKSGKAYLESDVLAAYFQPPEQSAYLAFNLSEEGAPPAHMYYAKAGLELNLFILKLGVQGMATQDKNYGGNVTLRFEF